MVRISGYVNEQNIKNLLYYTWTNLDALDWLIVHKQINCSQIIKLCLNAELLIKTDRIIDILSRIAQHGVLLNIHDCDIIIQNTSLLQLYEHKFNILDWMAQYNIYPSHNSVRRVMMDAEMSHIKHHVLVWLFQHGILPNQSVINEFLTSNIKIFLFDDPNVRLLIQYKLYPDQDTLNYFAANAWTPTLEFFEQYGLLPDYKGLNDAYQNNHSHIAYWILRRGGLNIWYQYWLKSLFMYAS